MRVLLLGTAVFLFGLSSAQHAVPEDLDPLDDIDEKEFEEYFHQDPVDDEEFKRRQAALTANEKEIKEINKEYEEGKKTWFDSINEFSNLPADEFAHEKTGLNMSFSLGLLDPLPEQKYHAESERYFDRFRYSRASVPSSYSSVDQGHVSPVKNQGQCGSCVAFASMNCVETCFKKITGVFGDYSEQQMVDCGYGINGAYGCNGASPHAYLAWAGDNKIEFAAESQYPYLNTRPNLRCPSNLPVFNQGAKISGSYYTYQGDEELMKKLVYEHGAVLAGVMASGPLQSYRGGIFSGCYPNSRIDHAISVVGYGTENGVDYWLIKNSWGTNWGENGYFRIQRGVGMCGIGPAIAATTCESTSGPTDSPPTTPSSDCADQRSDCDYYATNWCWQESVQQVCPSSCGLCPGQKPADSVTCYNKYSNCDDQGPYCADYPHIAEGCKKTCGYC